MNSGKKTFATVVITIIVVIVIIAAWNVAGNNASPSNELKLATNNCSFSTSSASANYSATIIAEKNYDGTVAAIKALVTKYNGEAISWSSYDQPYQTGPSATDTVSVTSTNISATIDVNDGDAFITALQGTVNASDTIESPSYSKTTGLQLMQSCMDDINNIQQAQLMAKLYLQEVPDAAENYAPAPTDNSSNDNGPSQYQGDASPSNLDNIYSDVQNAYSSANSYNDSLSSLLQSVNKMTVTVTINATDTPETYSPPYPSSPDDGSDGSSNGSDSGQYE